jgi:hypothetical protein
MKTRRRTRRRAMRTGTWRRMSRAAWTRRTSVCSCLYSPFAKKLSGTLRVGADGACGLLFCVAKRSGAFPRT